MKTYLRKSSCHVAGNDISIIAEERIGTTINVYTLNVKTDHH